MITLLVKIDLRTSADLVRNHWKAWLRGVAKAERQSHRTPYAKRSCFVIVNTGQKFEADVGLCEKLFDEMSAAYPDAVPMPIPFDVVLRQLRDDVRKEAGLALPKYFTPGAPESDEFKAWMEEIDRYLEIAGMRGRGRKPRKAKVTV